MQKSHPFDPVYDDSSQVLILGTLPSVTSAKRGFYYMHPQNRFWQILSRIYHEDTYHMSIEDKKRFILNRHLALYDVIHSCEIENSSDASIKNPVCTNLEELINQMPSLKRILLNGKTAYQIFIKNYPALSSRCICLPSTSSANARSSLEELTNIWAKAISKEE